MRVPGELVQTDLGEVWARFDRDRKNKVGQPLRQADLKRFKACP